MSILLFETQLHSILEMGSSKLFGWVGFKPKFS
jgi:hypothetical protein